MKKKLKITFINLNKDTKMLEEALSNRIAYNLSEKYKKVEFKEEEIWENEI